MQKGEAVSRILLVDDHPIVRQGIVQLVEQAEDLTVADEAENSPEALHKLERALFDLVVVDVSLESSNGIELVKAIRARGIRIPVLVLSMHDEDLYAQRALRAGANGYIMKAEKSATLLQAMRTVIHGDTYVSAAIAEKIEQARLNHSRKRGAAGSVDTLSDRELEIFESIGHGMSVKEVALKLHISAKTVETHRAHIRDKLNIENSNDLVRSAALWVAQESSQ